jgi:7-cyano-7-deazaguanine synthase in queuosine biosynthesis
MKDKTIVLWSGGVDSTGALYKILKEYDDDVVAHHIHYKNYQNRWEIEKIAVDTMTSWIRDNVRGFEYSESTFEIDLNFKGYDIMTAMYIGGIVIESEKRKDWKRKDIERYKLVLGDNAEDFNSYQWKTPIAQLLATISSLKHPQESQDIPYLWQIMATTTKQDIWNLLPDFLKENVWGCRIPKQREGKWIGCGKCSTCKELEVIGYINKFK